MRDDLPADILVDALIYDDRDPTKAIAHVALCHKQEDAPDFVAPADADALSGLPSVPFRKQLIGGDAPPLRRYLPPDGKPAIDVRVRGTWFRISLEQWLSLDADHTRVAHGISVTYRYDLFTEEHHQAMNEDRRENGGPREKPSKE